MTSPCSASLTAIEIHLRSANERVALFPGNGIRNVVTTFAYNLSFEFKDKDFLKRHKNDQSARRIPNNILRDFLIFSHGTRKGWEIFSPTSRSIHEVYYLNSRHLLILYSKAFEESCNQQQTTEIPMKKVLCGEVPKFFLARVSGGTNDHDQDHWLLTNVKRSPESPRTAGTIFRPDITWTRRKEGIIKVVHRRDVTNWLTQNSFYRNCALLSPSFILSLHFRHFILFWTTAYLYVPLFSKP